jgi:biotin operon repressor
MTQQELAELTRGSRQRVNKIIKEFEDEGILMLVGQKYPCIKSQNTTQK